MSQLAPAFRAQGRASRFLMGYGRLADGRYARAGAQRAHQHLRPAATGASGHQQGHVGQSRRRSMERDHRPADPHHVLGADGRSRVRAADRVLERRQPSARPRGRIAHARSPFVSSLGATRLRIVRQLIVESVLLAFISGLVGLGLGAILIRWFDAETQNVGKPYWMVFTMDASVVRLLRGRLPGHRHHLRTRPGAAHLEDERERGAEGRGPVGIGRPARASVDDRPHRRRADADAGTARRRRLDDAKFPEHVPLRAGLRNIPSPGHADHSARRESTRARRRSALHPPPNRGAAEYRRVPSKARAQQSLRPCQAATAGSSSSMDGRPTSSAERSTVTVISRGSAVLRRPRCHA